MFHPERLEQPAHTRKPGRVFVCSTSDWLHPGVPNDWIEKMIAMMVQPIFGGSHHTYILLSKRIVRLVTDPHCHPEHFAKWRNIWLGVTAENQARYDERWSILASIPAAVRFVSVEPMLGPVIPNCYDGKEPDWTICGPETGASKRPCKDEWIESLSRQSACFFDKRTPWTRREWPKG